MSRNLLEVKGVSELLQELIDDSQKRASPLIDALQSHLSTKTTQDRIQEAALILRELRGLMAESSWNSELFAPHTACVCHEIFQVIKLHADPELVKKIELYRGFGIDPNNAHVLKKICPNLLAHKRQ